ncbi:MAG TPA: YdjY domain-containing protein [Planctomycetaceae bacterium]|nr:YdjY domain-containing protein [Planctomycetaceae bacterium]
MSRAGWFAMVAALMLRDVEIPVVRGAENPPDKPRATADAGLVALNPQGTVLLDAAGKRLLLKAEVCLREGLLEMLVCLKQTKEHESILSVDTKAQIVHAGLLALGLEPGKPVQFMPEYKAATGPQLQIHLTWEDEAGKTQRVPAQKWVRNSTKRYWLAKLDPAPADIQIPVDSELRWDANQNELLWYGAMNEKQRDTVLKYSKDARYRKAIEGFFEQTRLKELKAPWVFSGSHFYTDKKTGETFYQAESGDLICVANFATATIDLAINSSAQADELMWEAHTERIPPIGTKVTIELQLDPAKPAAKPVQP